MHVPVNGVVPKAMYMYMEQFIDCICAFSLISLPYKHFINVLSDALAATALPGIAPVNPICLHMALASIVPRSALVSNPFHVPWLAKYRPTIPKDTLSRMLGSMVALSAGQSASLPLYGSSGSSKSIEKKESV